MKMIHQTLSELVVSPTLFGRYQYVDHSSSSLPLSMLLSGSQSAPSWELLYPFYCSYTTQYSSPYFRPYQYFDHHLMRIRFSFLTPFQTSFLSVVFITALGMILYFQGQAIRSSNTDNEDVSDWMALAFAGSLIATLFWVSSFSNYQLEHTQHANGWS